MTQQEKAELFKALHCKGRPLVLYNIWDAGGAKTLADAGAPAVATGSWSVAAANGFKDGEAVPLDFVLWIVERIANSVEVPLTVDFEGGYAVQPEEVAQNVRRIIHAGAIGINFEDRIVQGEGLHSIADQAARIKAIREVVHAEGVAVFINARTDLFLGTDPTTHDDKVAEALVRQAAYADAGADGFFVPGLSNLALIRHIADASRLPVNVMMRRGLTSIAEVADAGVARASYGPAPYASACSDLSARYKSLS